MELLRRALLVGCLLSGLWLVRLAPLDPLLTIEPIDFARMQKDEARSVPDDRKTEAQRRRAELPLSVYIEEAIQYNVFSATGPEWDARLRAIDARVLAAGAAVFARADDAPFTALAGRFASGGGTFVSFTRPGADVYYQVIEHRWTRRDFLMGKGLVADPMPPASLLYPFRLVGLAAALGGVALFVLMPASPLGRRQRANPVELGALAAAVATFAAPLFAMGGSVQALGPGLWLTTPCWIAAAVGLHLFAAPTRTAPDPLVAGDRVPFNMRFFREGLAFLAMALGPLGFLIWGTMILWNR